MITFTRCAILAKQACATFSQVVQKITPPIANNSLKFFFALFAMLALGVGNAWGEEATITFANKGLTNGTQYLEPFEIDANTTITFAGGGNDGKYYNTGSGMRTYGDGTITIACTNGTISEISFTWGGDSYKPTSDVANPVGYSKTTSKWTGSASSVTLTRPSGSGHWRLQKVTVTYETSGGETPGEGGNDPEEPGTDDDCVWQLVTSASNLKVGDEIVIAAKDYNYALSTTQNNNNRGKANITKNQDQTITFGDDVQIITLEEGVSYSGTYVFYAGTGYLYAAGANSNNYLKTSNQKIANGDWEIEITNGTAIVTAQGSASRNILKYNNNSGIFSCYASDNSMQDIVLYKKVCAVAQTYSVKKGTLENCKLKFSKTEDNFTNDELTGLVEKDYVYFTITPSSGYELKGEPVVKDASDNNVECVEEDGVWMFEMPASDVTVSVSCVLTVKTYKVTFNANGHGTAPTAQNVEENKKATEPTAPSATGYTFGGWYTDQACSDDKKFDFNTPITKDITLYAKWTANTYKITFNAGTGTCGTESATATYADGITLPTATPSAVCDEVGWTFAGWATSSVAETTSAPTLLKANDKYQPTSSITLYAVYSQTETNLGGGENSATLTFDNTSKRTEFTTEKQVWTENGITLTNIKGTQQGAADVGDYSNPARLYKGSTTLVETSNEILKIVFTCSSSAYANVLANTIGNTAESSESIVTVASVGANSYAIPALGDQVRLKSITVTYTASGTSTTTYNSNPNCTPPSEYTITWWANGEEYYTQTAVEGTAIDVPTNSPNAATYACEDKVFVGWVESEIDEATDEEPIYTTDFDKITGNRDFYAVFATEENNDESIFTVGKSGDFKIYALVEGANKYATAYDNGKLGSTSDENSAVIYTFTHKGENQYTIYNGSKYIAYGSGTNLKTQSGEYLWHIAPATNGKGSWRITSVSTTNRAIIYRTGYDFKAYGTTNITSSGYYDIEIGSVPTTTYSGYVTTCEKPIYTRVVKPGEYGTICLPYGSSDYTGAEFYEVSSVEYGKGLWLDQLAAGTALAAGKPYIFRATAEKLAVVYKGEKKDSPVDGVNGLTGTFTAIAANSTLVGHFIIAKNQIWVANDKNTLPAYRAYINAEDVPTTAQAQLPGRRRVCMGENAATGLDNITNGENNTIKVIENGQLIIIRNGEKFNVQGQKL